MRFAWACLSVHKDTGIVSIQNVVQQFVSNMMEDIVLSGGGREYFVKCELMFVESNLSVSVCKNALLLWVGFNPNENLDGIFTWI